MLQVLLVTLATVHFTSALLVTILHTPPGLTFHMSVTDKNIGSVFFNYIINDVHHVVQGTQTNDGWEDRISDIILNGADIIKVVAVVNDIEGKTLLTTPISYLTVGEMSNVMRRSPRRLKGAPYFRDDFNNFNPANWKTQVSMYGGWQHREFQVYTNDPKNVYTQAGNLYLRPIPTVSDPRFNENFLHTGTMDMKTLFGVCTEAGTNGCTRHGRDGLLPPIMSGMVMSVPSMQYGTLEIRARVPKGDWLWPAIWMKATQNIYGSYIRSGEIDIMEYYDYRPHYVDTTIHWGLSHKKSEARHRSTKTWAKSWHDTFHTWRMEWTPDHIVIFIDDKQVLYVDPGIGGFWKYGGFSGKNIWEGHGKMAPFDQPFYLKLNVAVGGTSGSFPDGNYYNGTKKPWSNKSPKPAEEFWNAHNEWLPSWKEDNVALQVDYVEFRHM